MNFIEQNLPLRAMFTFISLCAI